MQYFFSYLIGVCLTIILFIIFYNIYKKKVFQEERIKFDYKFGKIKISSQIFDISIKTKTWYNYLCSVLDRKLIFLLVVNLCSRASKLKFKTECKRHFDDSHIGFIIGNFSCFFVIFCLNNLNKIFDFLFKCSICCNSKEEASESAFSRFILIESISIIILSLIASFEIPEEWIKWISFKAIAISGSVNFVFSEYYSYQEINYLSISGTVSIAQMIFRGIEFLVEPFEKNVWYFIQFIPAIGAIIACWIHICFNYYKFIYCCNCCFISCCIYLGNKFIDLCICIYN